MSTIEGDGPVGNGSISNKRPRRKSEVWKYYHDLPDCERAICKACGKSLSAKSKMGTSHLKRHIETCQNLLEGGMNQTPFIDWQEEEVRNSLLYTSSLFCERKLVFYFSLKKCCFYQLFLWIEI